MGCIETQSIFSLARVRKGLIVIWDVLKHKQFEQDFTTKERLIVIWDVLKHVPVYPTAGSTIRLIVIWDVLKR